MMESTVMVADAFLAEAFTRCFTKCHLPVLSTIQQV